MESYKTENPQIEEADNWNLGIFSSSEWFISQLSTFKWAPNYFVHQLTVFLGKKILNVNIFFPPHWQTLIVWSFQKHWSNFLPFSDILKTKQLTNELIKQSTRWSTIIIIISCSYYVQIRLIVNRKCSNWRRWQLKFQH